MQSKKTKEETVSKFPTYKGHPLVRCGDTIYFGSMAGKFVVKIDIKTKKQVDGAEVADKVGIQLMSTDIESKTQKTIVKSSEKNGLYVAMDLADIWLHRALADK